METSVVVGCMRMHLAKLSGMQPRSMTSIGISPVCEQWRVFQWLIPQGCIFIIAVDLL